MNFQGKKSPLWTRILAVSPANEKALKALRRIWQKQDNIKLGRTSENSSEQETKSTGDKAANLSSKETDENSKNDEIELLSDKNVDYTKLRDFLAHGEWKVADMETARCMLKVAGRQKQGSLDVEDIDNFPCTDLRTIDQLWVKYSDGKFGFSVQKKIYQSVGGTKEYNREVWEKFGEQVGWRKGDEWLSYDELNWTRDTLSHYTAHLPSYEVIVEEMETRRLFGDPASALFGGCGSIFFRAETCRL
ncbi:MAG: GUN4 domain-containing protein [Okeania sp. SIO3H1]|nr:GUN4 domain-containing protein [Okeania sp. SIO3H1]